LGSSSRRRRHTRRRLFVVQRTEGRREHRGQRDDLGLAGWHRRAASRQFEPNPKLLSPYVTAGTGALSAQQDLLGLNGTGAQQTAISGIQSSPQFTALQQSGQNAILANASATGGLRGGNVQSALGQFSPQLLAQMIQQQYSNLGGLTSIGQNAAAGVGNAGQNTANSVTTLLGQQGSAAAGAALASGKADASLYNTLGSTLGTFIGSKF
jgi:hypothetical protein